MNQEGLLFPKNQQKKKRKKHHKSIIDRNIKESIQHLDLPTPLPRTSIGTVWEMRLEMESMVHWAAWTGV